MTDPEQPAEAPQPEAKLDVDEERERLEELDEESAKIRDKAKSDLRPGGSGRPFTDHGVEESVEETGDAEHPPADR